MKYLFIFLSVLLLSCSDAPINIGNDAAQFGLRGQVATFSENHIYYGLTKDEIKEQKEEISKQEESSPDVFYFNEDGNFIKQDYLSDDMISYYNYDDNGRLIEHRSEMYDGDLVLCVDNYKYDDEGRVSQMNRTRYATVLYIYKTPQYHTTLYSYTSEVNGAYLKEEFEDGKSSRDSRICIYNAQPQDIQYFIETYAKQTANLEIYDTKQCLIVFIHNYLRHDSVIKYYEYNNKNELISQEGKTSDFDIEYKLNNKGLIEQETAWEYERLDGETIRKINYITNYSYKFDSKGNWILQESETKYKYKSNYKIPNNYSKIERHITYHK